MPQSEEISNEMLWQGLTRASILAATTHKLYRYISIADQKAMGLIVMNSIIIPLAMNNIHGESYAVPATIAIATGVVSIFMAIICIFPKRKGGHKPMGQRNLLHFSEIGLLSEEEFMAELMPVYNDRAELAKAVVRDLHDVSSRVLIPKFRLLKISYIVFFIGYLAAILSFFYKMWF